MRCASEGTIPRRCPETATGDSASTGSARSASSFASGRRSTRDRIAGTAALAACSAAAEERGVLGVITGGVVAGGPGGGATGGPGVTTGGGVGDGMGVARLPKAVSYTHLTLPTILR